MAKKQPAKPEDRPQPTTKELDRQRLQKFLADLASCTQSSVAIPTTVAAAMARAALSEIAETLPE